MTGHVDIRTLTDEQFARLDDLQHQRAEAIRLALQEFVDWVEATETPENKVYTKTRRLAEAFENINRIYSIERQRAVSTMN